MFSTAARRQALFASLCLAIFTQQPVVPSEVASIIAVATDAMPVFTRAGNNSSACTAVGTICEASTVYDAKEKIWKRWFVESAHGANARGARLLRLATSADGAVWNSTNDVCFELEYDNLEVDDTDGGAPVVVQNSEGPAGRRFMLWYGTKSEQDGGARAIKVAFSPDGRHFTQTPVVMHVVGSSTPGPMLIDRLKELANAYSDASM